MKKLYKELQDFDYYLQLVKDNKKDFILHSTNYTKRIDVGQKSIFFSDTPTNFYVLKLINKVKNDAKEYIKKLGNLEINPDTIHWYCENIKYEGFTGNVFKLDLNAAYWTEAAKMGVISKDTLLYFESIEFKSEKDKKAARLKALGSLATIKHIKEYKNGRLSKEITKVDKDLRNLYLLICKNVSEYLKKYLSKYNCVYYYWDCVFIENERDLKRVGEEVLKDGFKFSVEKDEIQVINEGAIKGIFSKSKKKYYPIKGI